VTRVECDVGRKMVLNKEVLVKGNRGWARSGLEALASPIQPWYARNRMKRKHYVDDVLLLKEIDCLNSFVKIDQKSFKLFVFK